MRKIRARESEFGSNNIFDDEYDIPNNVLDVSKKEDNSELGTYDNYNNNNDDYDDDNRNRKKGKRFK